MGSGNKLQRQKKGPWVRGERDRQTQRQTEMGPPSWGLLSEVSGEDPNKTWSPLIGWHQGRASLAIAAGPNVSHGIVVLLSLVLLLFWAQS